MRTRLITPAVIGAASILLPASQTLAQIDQVNGQLIRLNDNGAWSWYQDERAILSGNKLLFSSIGNSGGQGGSSRSGVVDLVSYDLSQRQSSRLALSTIQADDHNSAALMVRPDGKYLAVYGNHGSDNYTRYRVSVNPGDASSFTAEQLYNNGVGATYSNTFYLPSTGLTYNFTRTDGYDPNMLVSNNSGSSWSYGGHFLRDPAGSSSTRPYVKYASNGVDKIFFLSTEGHPRDYNNSIYSGYISNGQMYRNDGTLIGPPGTSVADAPVVTNFSTVASASSTMNGEVRTHFWTTDFAVDDSGNPYATFTSRVNSSDTDHRFYYGRWDGTQWKVNQVAKAGGFLYSAENDYTGLISLDPDNPNRIYISSKINPATGVTTAHYEIFKGMTADGGSTWSWTAITSNSSVDNIRPIVPKSDGKRKALLWLRGTYSTYTSYNMAVVGQVDTPGETVGTAQFVDATISNTTRVSGSAAWNTGPATGQGAADNLWQRRSGFGNGGEVFTADENTAEDAPPLVSTANGLSAGQYDVFAYFWGNPNENWQIQAGLDASKLLTFEKLSSEQVTLAELNGAGTNTSGGSEYMYKAYVGRTTIGGAGQLQVFIDDGTGIGTSRTWYDGFGYARVTSPIAATQWLGTISSHWSNIENWSNAAPDGSDQQVTFGTVASGNRLVDIDSTQRTAASLTFDSALAYTLTSSNGGSLKLQSTTATATVNVLQGNHVISAPITIATNTTISTSAASNLQVTSRTNAAGFNITKTGSGILTLAGVDAGGLQVQAGTVRFSGSAAASVIDSLSVSTGAMLDLTDSAMVYRTATPATSEDQVRQMLLDGRIVTTLSAGGFAVGFADNSILQNATFENTPSPLNSVLVGYTLIGDADLDGKVNSTDFNRLAGNFGVTGNWLEGDFNYDGVINSTDFNLFVGNYGRTMPASLLGAIVPEPSLLSILPPIAMMFRRSRRRESTSRLFRNVACGAE